MALAMSGRGSRNLLLIVLGAVLLAWVWWSILADRDLSRTPRHGRESSAGEADSLPDRSGEASSEATGGSPEGGFEITLAALQRALDVKDGEDDEAQGAAAALRRLLRRDTAARQRAEGLLLGEDTPRELRMALAIVLGTVPGNVSDAALLNALERVEGDVDLKRCILFALGATREPPDDDEVFGLGDRPWGVQGPAGLGITVRREIEDPNVRQAIALRLSDAEAGVREAAAVALRHTTHEPDTRGALLAALRAEASDDVALVLGEALAVWAGSVREEAASAEVVTALLARAGDPSLEGYRFRMENDFRRIRLTDGQRELLAEYAHPARPFEVRSFAMSVLAAAARHSGAVAMTEARTLLERYLGADREDAIRDLSARLLGTLAPDSGTITKLAAASRADRAWNVRYQALDALARFAPDSRALEALRAATADADERVASRARELLERLAARSR